MKRPYLVLSLLLAFILVLPVQAQTPRTNFDQARLSFRGTTAYCNVTIFGNSNEKISATIKLWDGKQCIETWNESATGALSFSESVTVKKGQSYTLTADYTVADKPQRSLSSSGTCE